MVVDICQSCSGSGCNILDHCRECGGSGIVEEPEIDELCDSCNGEGFRLIPGIQHGSMERITCGSCGGTGMIEDDLELWDDW